MDLDDRDVVDEIHFPGSLRRPQDAEAAIGALYQAHALGLIRLAYVMLGDRPGAEDVVQDAFRGLHRHWEAPDGPGPRAGDLPAARRLSRILGAARRRAPRGDGDGPAVARPPASGAGAALRFYRAFTEVAAAADDRTFVLVAEEGKAAKSPSRVTRTFPRARFYVQHLDPASHTAGGQVRLQALPATYIPVGSTVMDMALSAVGTSLAATIGDLVHSKLYVFHLLTGGQHVWNWFDCGKCGVGTASGFTGPYPRVLSWPDAGVRLPAVGPSEDQVRLLDTDAPEANLFADSKLARISLGGPGRSWLDATLTPDGRTILAVRELVNATEHQLSQQQLVTFSAATGKPTAILSRTPIGADYEQIQWTSRSGRELLITGAQRDGGAEVLKDGHATQIPWSTKIFDAAW